jgi:hypothetical protein
MHNQKVGYVIFEGASTNSQELLLRILATSCESFKTIGQSIDFIRFLKGGLVFTGWDPW